ncbi:response regulator [Reichenbachiella agarivorans]|uniref:Response regulator n=1 Tax=Reichenbachiella agarivorans TaxID=2979464 RepID=A0ABY6CRT5_9BACT|nr:response regulator [Reichenbachiella agarivorans]UXP33231.1 response regulator [Reichenbachiella agarivorans]
MTKEAYSCVCIDDDKLFIEIISGKIRQLDFLDLIACYNNPMTALVKVDQLRPDIIFLDVDLPEINGFTFMDALDYKPIIVMMTSHWEQEEHAIKKGVDAFLTKPLKSAEQISDALFKLL